MRTLIQGEEYSAENGCIDNEKWCAGARAHRYEIIIQAGVPEDKITEYMRRGLTTVVEMPLSRGEDHDTRKRGEYEYGEKLVAGLSDIIKLWVPLSMQ